MIAFVYTGQGGHDISLIDYLEKSSLFRDSYDLIAEIVGDDIVKRARREGAAYLRRNEIASLLVVLSACSWHAKLSRAGVQPAAVAGYSVGQWTAMHFAGMLDFPTLLAVVWRRAQLMNDQARTRPGAMLGVIGLPLETVAAACAEASQGGLQAAVSNINCLGQFTVAGDVAAIDRLAGLLHNARKLARINVSGAWHCPLMAPAAALFAAEIDVLMLKPAMIPVADNVTGERLPEPGGLLRQRLSEHLCQPVLWQANMRWLADQGVTRFVEVGHGDMLTRFGFFIDRRLQHMTAAQLHAGKG